MWRGGLFSGMCPGCVKEGSREGQGLERPLNPWKGFECSKSLGSGLLALGKPSQPVLEVVHTSLLPPRGSTTTSCPPLQKAEELGQAGLAVVTLVFSCLQRDLGRGEQRTESGLASHGEYRLSLQSPARSQRRMCVPLNLTGGRGLALMPESPDSPVYPLALPSSREPCCTEWMLWEGTFDLLGGCSWPEQEAS